MENQQIDFRKALRSLIIFQLKLAADALRDLVMSPVSIIMFLADVLLRPRESDSHYRQLMKFGRKTDRWINLFEEYDDAGMPLHDDEFAEKHRKQ